VVWSDVSIQTRVAPCRQGGTVLKYFFAQICGELRYFFEN
jgi:hypothetical protein